MTYLKPLATVFFALFVLSACGGEGGAAAPAATAVETCEQQGLFDNGTECVAKLTLSDCMSDGYNGVNESTNECATYTAETCQTDSKFWDSSNCVAKLTLSDCMSDGYNGVNESTNECATYTEATCVADGKYWGSGNCVAKLTTAGCNNDGYNGVNSATNTCVAYTAAECKQTQGKKFANDKCTDLYLATEAGYYEKTEYYQSGALAGVKAAEAYANISSLTGVRQAGGGQIVSIASEYGFNTTHQEFGTEGAAFDSIYDANLNETYTHDISTSSSTKTITDNNQYALNNNPVTGGGGNCNIAQCNGTQYASLIAGRKDAVATNADKNMHGIAYNAKIKGILVNFLDETQRINTIENGVGADIIAMNHVWQYDVVSACYTYDDDDDDTTPNIHKTYYRPLGANRLPNNYINVGNDSDKTNDTCDGGTVSNDTISADELTAWTEAVNPDATNNTIMVFSAGNNGLNSETGFVSLFDANGKGSERGVFAVTAVGGDPLAVNIPAFRAAYPALYTESGTDGDFTSDRWLTVIGLQADDTNTAVDESKLILSSSNGCGVAMHFCLAAPSRDIHVASEDGTDNNEYQTDKGTAYASSTVAGALAVLKGAFPNATPEQLTRLVLETADYIALDNKTNATDTTLTAPTEETDNRMEVTNLDGSTRYINPVYGYGRLNLEAATTPSVASSYVN